ncbi:type I polyketide synthase [Longimicrobium sp.]|uniref:type I polyketide synthase n=1 Tax=Longimicrobium sp. TaxID=2029185 RepID=UPI002CDACC1A|nr:beta-ketoacyl synthase N-terminal-like domain-containing protein [Longimicrobium sp.]HSU14719.1 beta-ketoacyl synthase N-terminal-like domain-containing protein [Longimicrobium sp.]
MSIIEPHSNGTAEGPDIPESADLEVAIIGMAGRFPGADDLDAFWANLQAGIESISRFGDDELRAAGVSEAELANPDYVKAIGRLRDVEHFDAGFFGYSPREAEVLEPGHRLFLECAWEALEDAGVDPDQVAGRIGVYAGAGSSGYAERHVKPNAALMESAGGFQVSLGSEKDFLATRVSYKLDLRGPSLAVQTGCSTSLVAIHLAAQSLLRGECELALAGGASVIIPQTTGYLWQHGGIVSPDGSCRAFDTRSGGAVSGSGVGAIVLKRLSDALRDGDAVRAVIRGSAINNDGGAKVAFTAPGVEGQSAVIAEALEAADVDPDTVTYVEAHGTGTELGDVIEIAALTRAFRAFTNREGYCAVGSVKTNIGHLDTAAGVAGLIKTVLAMEHRRIPPTVHFAAPNPRIAFAGSPFRVAAGTTVDWAADGPRRAGVSSFGIGGTNAHVVLEEAPAASPSGPSRPWQLLAVSARGASAAQAQAARLADHLQNHPDLPLADVAHTLREGRHAFAHRRIAVVRQGEDAAAILRGAVPERIAAGVAEAGARSVAFLFPGLGDHYPNMARGLYEAEPAFRAEVDRCAEILRPLLGADIREALFPGHAPSDAAPAQALDLRAMVARSAPTPEAAQLNRTALAQPAVFVVDYALARLWMSWGIAPDALIGHSLGEYAAACIAGVLSLEDALTLVAERAKTIEPLPGGAMLAISRDPTEIQPHLAGGVAIATVNAPGLCVVAGPEDAVADLERRLGDAGIVARRLPTTHAFHTPMLAPVAGRLTEIARSVRLRPPRIPMISNVTGTWITDAEATDPEYWTRHMLGTVRFADGVGELLREPGRVLLEVGPGQTLSTFVRQRPGDGEEAPVAVIPSMRHAFDRRPDQGVLLEALGRLWLAGVKPDWTAFRGPERRRKVHLPTYPWEKQRYWVDAPTLAASAHPARASADPAEWTYLPDWRRSPAPPSSAEIRRVLVLAQDDSGDALATALRQLGREATVRRIPASAERDGVRAVVDGDSDAVAVITPDPVTLLMLGAAMAHAGSRARLIAITRDAHDVTGREALDVGAAAVAAAALVVTQEHAPIRARTVDVEADARDLARLAAELVADADDQVIALRGPHRWARGFRAAKPAAPAATVREGGAYLLVGGVEGQNAVFARALARVPGVRLAAITVDGRVSGPEEPSVLALRADPADASSLAAAIGQAEARFGRIDGVLWTPSGADISLAAADEAKPAWRAELARIAAQLDALDTALGGREMDFCLTESSLAGVLGGVGLVRAALLHAQADAIAQRHARGSRPRWTSVAADRWLQPGESASGIPLDAAEAVLRHALALAAEPVVLVSPTELEARLRGAAHPEPHRPEAARYARPDDLGIDYAAPQTELEERIAAVWQELLGLERIGVHDDFFALGGHSLLATQIVGRLRDLFELELPLAVIFEAPTVAKMAVLVEDAFFAEIEAMTDEEAAAMVGR